ncbi:PREDICTED: nucleoprotein TPR-like [Rhagoletis zephyria]|uniref:nucleoprotein TPR-like n=1 Tax=Rhagoletis zephyria TaxID=28612 RepID=UPI0008112E21|nr:PREDICTED: nucleoprotein TPR-like [Rhagoletis zephyria]
MEVEEISSGDLKLQLQRLTSELEDKNSIIQQLNDENNLLKQSKSDIADHYIEKLFPNVAGLCQLFNSNVSVNQLYSMYIQERRLNGDLKLKVDNSKVEQTVITERLSLLNNELDAARETIQQLSSEILELKKLEEKVFQVENDNKETNIALRFYQDSALSLYKGLKEFKEIFLALSVKIQHLAHPSSGESTTNNTEDATGIKTLKYILELQTKFQDFNRLQTEFEKGKLDLVSMKKNFIDTDHEIEALRNQVSFLESEKRISTKQYDLLHSEYVTLANLLNHLKASNENKVNHLQSINGQLQAQVQKLTQTVEQLKCDHNKFVESKAKERQELEAKLLVCEKDLESANKKVISQKGFLSQMETSLDSFRKQNKNLNEINSKLTGNINGQLSSRENEICQLTQKLQAEEERNKKLEAEIRDINSKYASQSGQIESLQQELANFKNSSTQRHQIEINNLKSSLAKSNELKVNQGKEILTLKSEIARVQSTNQQLKALARKYKTQYEEQKQVTNTLSISGDDQKENSTELTNQIIAKDERISALEEKLASTLSELGAAKQEVINASSANAELQSQYNETDQRAKKIASSAQQRIIELKRILAEKNSEIAALRTERQTDDMYLINQPSTSKASFTLLSSSSKMPISSTSISSRSSTVPSSSFESAISSNINQPSSSNEENFNLDSLQSTQITSHSTSDDNSSELFSSIVADSNVSSNKRGYSSDSDPGHLGRKNRRNETDEVTTYEDESSNQSAIVNIEEDSNDDSAAVPTDAASAAVAAVSAPGSSSANYTSSNGESVESADNDTQMDSQMEEPNAIDQMNSPDDQPDEQEQQQEQQSFAQEQQQQQSPNSASSCN